MNATPVDAVVFDLGQVLIAWDPHPAIAKGVGQEQARGFLADPAFDFLAWNRQQDAGRSWDRGEEVAVTSHPHWEAAIRAYRENFGESLVGAIEDTVQILRELHAAGIPLYGLTNWSEELFPVARSRFDFLDLFEDIIVSGEEGVAKPDPGIFDDPPATDRSQPGPLHLHRRQPGQHRGCRRGRPGRHPVHRHRPPSRRSVAAWPAAVSRID